VYQPACSQPRLTFGQARAVGKYFEGEITTPSGVIPSEALRKYEAAFEAFCKANGLRSRKESDPEKGDFRLRYQLTPVVQLPAHFIEFRGLHLVSRESVTVCVGESRSKLWLSLSFSGDDVRELDAKGWLELNRTFRDYVDLRSPSLREYYVSVIARLIEMKASEFERYAGTTPIELEPVMRIMVSSIESPAVPDEVLQIGQASGRGAMQGAVEQDAKLAALFDGFYKGVESLTGADRDLFGFYIQSTSPSYEEEGTSLPYVISGRSSLQRRALLMTIREEHDDGPPMEYYFTFGSSDQQFTERRYRNSDLSSRSLMMEVGRAF
jgi:hypothetical protein